MKSDHNTFLQKMLVWPHLPNPGETFEQWATECRQLSALVQRTLAHRIVGYVGGSLLPTPTRCANMLSPSMQKWKSHRNLWPTPTAHIAKETNAPSEAKRDTPTLAALVGGSLNPTWVEWLMGFPLEFTACKHWVTRKSQLKPHKHGAS